MEKWFLSCLFIIILISSCQGIELDIVIDDCDGQYIIANEKIVDLPELEPRQSMAFYGGKGLFLIPSSNALLCDIYDLTNKKKEESLSLSVGNYPVPHANVACFGNQLLTDNSVFPLLYVSAWNEGREAFVFDISRFADSYVGKLIQVIDSSEINRNIIGDGCLDWVVDDEGGFLYTIAYHINPSTLIEGNYSHIAKFILPSLEKEKVILQDMDVIEYFIVPVMNVSQDKFFHDNHIYVAAGYPYEGYSFEPKYYDINVFTRELHEYKIPLGGEPQGFCYYEGKKWINMYGAKRIINLNKSFNLI